MVGAGDSPVMAEPCFAWTGSRPPAPASLDGEALDAADVMGEQPYTLEVSSPGVGRPLAEPRHFQRNVGRLVRLRHGAGEVTGRVVAADRAAVTVEVAATAKDPSRTETLAYGDVERAEVLVEFARPDESKES